MPSMGRGCALSTVRPPRLSRLPRAREASRRSDKSLYETLLMLPYAALSACRFDATKWIAWKVAAC
jgi:hypothetical protein